MLCRIESNYFFHEVGENYAEMQVVGERRLLIGERFPDGILVGPGDQVTYGAGRTIGVWCRWFRFIFHTNLRLSFDLCSSA